MGVNYDLNLTKVSDQVCPASLDESEQLAVNSSQTADALAPNVSFLDGAENENVCRPGDDAGTPLDDLRKVLQTLTELPGLLAPNPSQKQVQDLQKQASDLANMTETLTNLLRMMEQNTLGHIRG